MRVRVDEPRHQQAAGHLHVGRLDALEFAARSHGQDALTLDEEAAAFKDAPLRIHGHDQVGQREQLITHVQAAPIISQACAACTAVTTRAFGRGWR